MLTVKRLSLKPCDYSCGGILCCYSQVWTDTVYPVTGFRKHTLEALLTLQLLHDLQA